MTPEKQYEHLLKEAEIDPDVYATLQYIFVDQYGPREKDENTVCFSDPLAQGFGVLLTLAAPILYQWAKDTLNHRRARLEVDEVKQRAELILWMRANGWPQETATVLVERTLDGIAKRNKDDKGVEKLLNLVSQVVDPANAPSEKSTVTTPLLSAEPETDTSNGQT